MSPQSTTVEDVQARSAARLALEHALRDAREALEREAYRLDTIEIRIELAQADIRKLESLTLAGLLAALTGSKAGQIDARRQACAALAREQDASAQALEELKQQVDQLTGQLAEYSDVEAVPASPAGEAGSVDGGAGARACIGNAIEAGESLLQHMSGMHKLCSHLRHGPSMFKGAGALLSTAVQAYKGHVASGVTSQIAASVRDFSKQLGKVPLDPQNTADAEIVAEAAQLERFADPSTHALDGNADAWVELEVLARTLVTDLQDKMARP